MLDQGISILQNLLKAVSANMSLADLNRVIGFTVVTKLLKQVFLIVKNTMAFVIEAQPPNAN